MLRAIDAILRHERHGEAARLNKVVVDLRGKQPKVVDLGYPADFILVKYGDDVDASRVYIAINGPATWVTLHEAQMIYAKVPVITRLLIRWDADQEGKRITIYYSGGATIFLGMTLVSLVSTQLNKIISYISSSIIAERSVTLDNTSGSSTARLPVFDEDVEMLDSGTVSIQMYFDKEVVARLRLQRGSSIHEAALNAGAALSANAWYEFEVSVARGDKLNILVDVPAGEEVTGYVALFLRRR